MPRIEVAPEQLSGGGARQAALAGRVSELRGRLEAAGAQAAGACGDAGAAGAVADYVGAWGVRLDALASSVGGLAGNLGAASGAYVGTDASAFPAGGR